MSEPSPASAPQADVPLPPAPPSPDPFELSVLAALRELGFSCEHRGSYVDLPTRTTLGFDIRALRRSGDCFLRVAAECVYVAPDLSLVMSCRSIGEEEFYREVVLSVDSDRFLLEKLPAGRTEHLLEGGRALRLRTRAAPPAGASIGTESVLADLESHTEGPDVHEEWERAVRSAEGLTLVASGDGRRIGGMALTLVLPALVVPDGRLWRVDRDPTGRRVVGPEPVDRCSFLVGRAAHAHTKRLSVFHAECVTLRGLHQLVEELTGSEQALESAFPWERALGRQSTNVGPRV